MEEYVKGLKENPDLLRVLAGNFFEGRKRSRKTVSGATFIFFNIYMFMIRLVRDGDREFEATAEDYERIYAFVFRVSGPPAPNIR